MGSDLVVFGWLVQEKCGDVVRHVGMGILVIRVTMLYPTSLCLVTVIKGHPAIVQLLHECTPLQGPWQDVAFS